MLNYRKSVYVTLYSVAIRISVDYHTIVNSHIDGKCAGKYCPAKWHSEKQTIHNHKPYMHV